MTRWKLNKHERSGGFGHVSGRTVALCGKKRQAEVMMTSYEKPSGDAEPQGAKPESARRPQAVEPL